MRNYYTAGALSLSDVEKYAERAIEAAKQTIRSEAAKGAAPAAKKSVTPIVVGSVAVSALALLIALRK